MKTETLEEWKERTKKEPKKVDFSQAYKGLTPRWIKWDKKRKLAELNLKKQIERDKQSIKN